MNKWQSFNWTTSIQHKVWSKLERLCGEMTILIFHNNNVYVYSMIHSYSPSFIRRLFCFFFAFFHYAFILQICAVG